MTSDRVQRRIDRLLEQADEALDRLDWEEVRARAGAVLNLDPANNDALTYLAAASRGLGEEDAGPPGQRPPGRSGPDSQPSAGPASFVGGRYAVKRFLGEGGKKQVYLAHDTLLDRDVAFAVIKTEGLDDIGRDRITREAQAMGRLGAHPHIVSVFDLGDESGQPYIVTELMGGGDVEGLIEKAPEHRPSLERTLEVGVQVCRGLEFAHSHGIVHRDLKPGNVWLTADGTAKLGDFGLAVALDRSRLTQAGMMVGTVSYMPPEQAMGGEVTPRSDLYSLGAMLYEMVAGRPPFIGDESVAIITQHLNVAPVSPSWHNPQTPAGVETLILRLLEKDPAKRPASAKEVEAVLESVLGSQRTAGAMNRAPTPVEGRAGVPLSLTGEGQGEGETRAGTEGQAAPTDNPVYRRTFVGREAELLQLQAAYDAALSGHGSLAMVVGEPGIGKTSLCEQLATYATIRAGKTLVGHCYEEGSLSLPYLPFVEAMRNYVLDGEPERLRREMGSGAGDIARIVSEVRERVAVEPVSQSSADAEEQRYRLYQAVTGFLRNAAAVQPLMIVLEDLHDADRGTLDLLLHLARNLEGSRLLLVGTYRDIEVDRSHPLSAALAELRRSASFRRVLLRGLTVDEVRRMLPGISGQEISGELAEAVHRQTEGNPLFVQEVLRYLVEEGLITHGGGRWRASGDAPLTVSIPEGLRDVIGKRLSRLSPDCNRLLAIAAVIGRDFRLDTLQAVAGVPEEPLLVALEEATRAAVLSEQARVGGVQYRFAHAFFRQTLHEELSVPRRLRMHQEVAQVLERQYGNRLEEHAAELAEHFAQSTDAGDLRKAIGYAEQAAGRALAVYAYGEAARHLDQALDVQEVLDPDAKAERCDLLLALAEVLLPAGDESRVVEMIAPEAVALADEVGDRQRAARACAAALDALKGLRGATSGPLFQHWLEQADRYAEEGSADRVRADVARSMAAYFSGRQREAWDLLQRALALAKQLDDGERLYRAAWMLTAFTWLPEHQEEQHRLTEELFLQRRTGVSGAAWGSFLYGCCAVFLAWGEWERFEDASREVVEIAERTHDVYLLTVALGDGVNRLVLDGRLEEALAASEKLRQQATAFGVPGNGADMAFRPTFWAMLYLGRAEEALAAALPERSRGRLILYSSFAALCLGSLGRWTETQELLEQLQAELRDAADSPDLNIVGRVIYLAAAVLAENRQVAAALSESLRDAASLIVTNYPTCIARHLGAASALLGEREAARRYYEQALEVAGRVHFRPEVALTHLQLAELLLEDADEAQHARALAHLDFAIGEFREMKMRPALEQAIRHKAVLKA